MIKIQLINDVTIQSTNLPGKTEKIKTWVDFIKSTAKSLKFGVAKLLTKLKMLLVFGWRKLSLVYVNGRQKSQENHWAIEFILLWHLLKELERWKWQALPIMAELHMAIT